MTWYFTEIIFSYKGKRRKFEDDLESVKSEILMNLREVHKNIQRGHTGLTVFSDKMVGDFQLHFGKRWTTPSINVRMYSTNNEYLKEFQRIEKYRMSEKLKLYGSIKVQEINAKG